MMRLLRNTVDFKELVAQVLTYDYLGALFASVLFPLLFVPQLGLVRTSLVIGLLNAVVALYSIHLFRDRLGGTGLLLGKAVGTIVLLSDRNGLRRPPHLALGGAPLRRRGRPREELAPYQRMVVAEPRGLPALPEQPPAASVNEYRRYHEALVHPAFSAVPGARRVLVCGGGDGPGRARGSQARERRERHARGPRPPHHDPVARPRSSRRRTAALSRTRRSRS